MKQSDIEKRDRLADVTFDILATETHRRSPFNHTFIKTSIANAMYNHAPKLQSGMISVKAKEKLDAGEIERKKLCKEHPYPRTRTALDIINVFDKTFRKTNNTEIKMSIGKIIENGSKINFVLTEENQKLYPFQQDYTLSEEEIYSKAGVELVEDEDRAFFTYTYQDKKFFALKDMSKETGLSMYAIKKMIDNGEIEKK